MAQNDRRGGSSNQARPMTDNQQTTRADKLNFVLRQLLARQEELEAVLPPDIPFKHFHAVVNQALRNNPDVLDATPVSIVNACVKAAYDHLRLDGREAALVTHRVNVARKGEPDRWETHAQYFPMVFGLVQQVLRGGEVIALEATVVYENDAFDMQRGTNPYIAHKPLVKGDRGEPIGVYSIATYRTGYVGFEYMTEKQVLDVRAASKAGEKDGKPIGIWKRWPDAMWKKTVIRQHRKTLPLGGRDIFDAEAREMFEPLPGQTTEPAAIPARPTRQPALEQHGSASGVQLFDTGDVPQGALVEAVANDATERTAPADGVKKTATKAQPLQGDADIPEDDAAWAAWAADVEKRIMAATDAPAVHRIETEEADRLKAATPQRRDFLKSLITDRLADIASDAAADQANGSED